MLSCIARRLFPVFLTIAIGASAPTAVFGAAQGSTRAAPLTSVRLAGEDYVEARAFLPATG